MAWAAAELGVPLATACTEIRPGDVWEVTRERAGGILLEDAALTAPIRMVTLRPGSPSPSETAAADEMTVHVVVPELDVSVPRARLVERRARAAGMTLTSAPVVIAGGRGVGSSEGYAVLEELAGLVGGAVGCSRVATNNGWRPHADQVGLTGTRISPDLYVACGISGATQHWVGCMNARSILAVNTDPEAPMVTRATWAVIGDVHEVLPAVVAEIRRRSGR
jgi:electron transfer flavoprotein alpha subunit